MAIVHNFRRIIRYDIMKPTAYILIIALSISLSSCIGYYRDMSYLSDDELRWIDCAEIGDTILFDSDSLHCDTMVITDKYNTNRWNRFFIHFIDNHLSDYHEAKASIDFDIKGNDHSISNNNLCMAKLLNDSLNWYMNFGSLNAKLWPPILSNDNSTDYSQNPIKITTVKLRGRQIPDCLLFDSSNCNKPNSAYDTFKDLYSVECCIFRKGYGLIYYKLGNGEEFYRRFD